MLPLSIDIYCTFSWECNKLVASQVAEKERLHYREGTINQNGPFSKSIGLEGYSDWAIFAGQELRTMYLIALLHVTFLEADRLFTYLALTYFQKLRACYWEKSWSLKSLHLVYHSFYWNQINTSSKAVFPCSSPFQISDSFQFIQFLAKIQEFKLPKRTDMDGMGLYQLLE